MSANENIKLSSIEDIIQDAKAGKMFILVDDENRENEGDLVIPAEFANDKAVNFMAKHGRGLICLAVTRERAEQLELPLMSQNNRSRHQTAFTISIEAREGVSTGISAADRARTIEVAVDPEKTKYDLVTPGHVFPLIAKDGGVLVRAGHTEAAVDISRLAGLNSSGVICEIMNDDGTMARLPDLVKFAEEHSLNIATIADLIEYRRAKEKLIEKVEEVNFSTDYAGDFRLCLYRSKLEYAEHLALVKGDISNDDTIPVRMHQLDVISDVLNAKDSPKSGQLKKAIKMINDEGKGVVVLLRSPDKQSLTKSLNRLIGKTNNEDSSNKDITVNAIRDYGIGAQILTDIGVRKMKLLTNTGKNIIALDGYGLSVESYKRID